MILGRPKERGKSKLDKHREEIIALLKNGSTKAYIAKRYGTTQPNLYTWLRMNKITLIPSSNRDAVNRLDNPHPEKIEKPQPSEITAILYIWCRRPDLSDIQ